MSAKALPKCRALIAAAGLGTRSGLPYPKTLYPVHGVPILIRILDLLAPYDDNPVIVVSPAGRRAIEECLAANGRQAELIEQESPRGMGDAVLRFERSSAYASAEHVLLIWGDIPFIQPQTVRTMVDAHAAGSNDFTFVTRHVESAYTVIERDERGAVQAIVETRQSGATPAPGEREVGLFIFRRDLVFKLLKAPHPDRIGRNGEHGFLYVVSHLARVGARVEGLPVATELDCVSLNKLSDLDGVDRHG